MAKLGKVNADLMRAACFQSARQQREAGQLFFGGYVGDRFLACSRRRCCRAGRRPDRESRWNGSSACRQEPGTSAR